LNYSEDLDEKQENAEESPQLTENKSKILSLINFDEDN